MEAQPFADADPENFEKEYDTVSALLGEGAKKFLGIPPGPLQVGHFVLALAIFLMAFIEYPGFPLTNLPSPLRGCLQGGKCYHFSLLFPSFGTYLIFNTIILCSQLIQQYYFSPTLSQSRWIYVVPYNYLKYIFLNRPWNSIPHQYCYGRLGNI